MAPFRSGGCGIADLNAWIVSELRPLIQLPGGFEKGVEAAFLQALHDGVTRLEMSIDVTLGALFGIPATQIIGVLQQAHVTVAPGIVFLPEMGFPRTRSLRSLLAAAEPFFASGYFRVIDLYDDEEAQSPAAFRELYRLAGSLGMKRKAHAGEFGTAESVREAVEVLELDAVQHGIGAAGSAEVMRWLADRGTVLNTCPTSNVRLKRVSTYKTHPIRILDDHGVRITVNTDDALVFGDGVSEQYMKLLRAGIFSPGRIDLIRKESLRG